MTLTSRTRPPRAVAVLGAGVLLAAGTLGVAGPASAAPEPAVQYTSDSFGGVVDLVLTLPTALPSVPNPAELTLIGTEGAAAAGGAARSSDAVSYLAGGSVVDNSPLSPVLAPLSNTAKASLAKPGPVEAMAARVPANPLGLAVGIGGQRAVVTPATGANTATSTLADASLGSLRSLGLGALLDPLFAGLDTAVGTIVTSAKPLTDGLAGVPSLPSVPIPNPLMPVVGGPATIPTPTVGGPALAGTVTELPARLAALEKQLTDGPVLALTGLDTAQTNTSTASTATGTGRAKLAKASLFGGLVTVDATEASATATAGLTKAAATSSASATLVKVTVADSFGQLLTAVASDKGVTAGLLDGSLGMALDPTVRPTVAAVDSALNAVLTQLTDLLTALGGGAQLIKQGTTSTTVSPDGRKAEAHADPALVTLGLPVAKNLLTLAIGKADATATVLPVAARLTPPPPSISTPEAGTLPRTGADATTGVLALVLTGAGLLLWRRRTA